MRSLRDRNTYACRRAAGSVGCVGSAARPPICSLWIESTCAALASHHTSVRLAEDGLSYAAYYETGGMRILLGRFLHMGTAAYAHLLADEGDDALRCIPYAAQEHIEWRAQTGLH